MARTAQKTKESFNQELIDFSDGHFSLVGEYVTSSNGKCKIKCNITNKIFERECRNALKTKGCPFCSDKKYLFEPPEKRYFNYKEKFHKLCEENGYELITPLITASQKVSIKHNRCGKTFYIKPKDFKENIFCRCCESRDNIIKTNNIVKRTNDVKNKLYDLIGNEYSLVGEYINAKTKIKLKHNICGHEYDVLFSNFKKGNRCPYCMCSKGEQKIMRFLEYFDIEFVFQKKFCDLFGVGGKNLSYDFYVPKYNTLIEYQGEFHNNSCGASSLQDNEQYEIQKIHDVHKKEYAIKNNIHLLEIWYYDFENVEKILFNYFGISNLLKHDENKLLNIIYSLDKRTFDKLIYILNNFNYEDYLESTTSSEVSA